MFLLTSNKICSIISSFFHKLPCSSLTEDWNICISCLCKFWNICNCLLRVVDNFSSFFAWPTTLSELSLDAFIRDSSAFLCLSSSPESLPPSTAFMSSSEEPVAFCNSAFACSASLSNEELSLSPSLPMLFISFSIFSSVPLEVELPLSDSLSGL